ncbi:TspO/MBR family protein [Mycobacterium celatum]|uniref:Tryptophan-rich sensory protein n=1 Tax=Mycobacterium celatum TaxID=28045 RepID=A0A1X1RUR7_MYCCE|nr:TspO/MBR family protein [Mycobacterium celatum]ORV18148.1 TspO protein [Mycobacterium celatum]PIB80621.1 tryptophan-rich sensory protein [Mycobacterium celatum]
MRISTLTATAVSAAGAAVVGGLASGPSVRSPWYARLRKPSYQPPAQVFPVVWPTLYADIALVSASAIDQLHDDHQAEKARAYQAALALNLVLNGSWSWIFFNRHHLAAAAAVAAALTASSADLTRRAVAVRGATGAALGLYPLWCAFATVLSTHIWLLNRRRRRGSR